MNAAAENPTPTAELYAAIEQAYQFFNERLFEGRLMPCLFVMQRGKNTKCGHFHAEIWDSTEHEDYAADEMSLNPNALKSMGLTETLQTLAHEMCHLEQFHFGEPSRNGYHNKEWGGMMDRIGLTPSNTGEEGGKRTGQQMADFITPGGPFEEALAELLEGGFVIPWVSKDTTPPPSESKSTGKTKFTCPACKSNAWGKPELRIICTDCTLPLIAKDTPADEARDMLAPYLGAKEIALMLGLSTPAETPSPQVDLEDYIKTAKGA